MPTAADSGMVIPRQFCRLIPTGASVTNSVGAPMTLTNFAGENQPQGFYWFAITP
jgi:hypothetical protein